jgi:signal peptidase I
LIKQKGNKKKDSGFFDFFKTIFYAVIIAVIFRSLFFEPYNIPSGSMLPNLLIGDYLFVSKYSYGYSRYSFPFGIIPLPKNRVFASEPKRGDVAVFKLPSKTSINYIKRVIGLPGDTIQMKSGRLFINGSLVVENNDGFYKHIIQNKFEQIYEKKKEQLSNGKSFSTLNLFNNAALDNTNVFLVPENHYFVMGDNRDNSLDSRAKGGWFVPLENFVGKGSIIFFSMTDDTRFWQFWKWPFNIRYKRIFKKIN